MDNNIKIGAFFMIVSVTGFALMDLAVKWTTDDYSVGYVIFWRMLGGLIPLIFTIPRDRWAHLLTTKKPGLHFVRAFAGTTALFCVYTSLHYLPLATTVSLTFASPIFSTLLSIFILGEIVGSRRWTAIAIGFMGVLVIVNPTSSEFNYYMIFPILCAMCYAGAMIIIKVTSDKDNVYAQTFHFYFTAMILCPISAFIGNILNLHDPSNQVTDFMFRSWAYNFDINLVLMILVGLTAVLAFVFTISAYRLGKPYIVAPFEYILLVWAVIYGRLIWGETISSQSWVGIFIIVTGGIYIFYRERINNQILATDQTIR